MVALRSASGDENVAATGVPSLAARAFGRPRQRALGADVGQRDRAASGQGTDAPGCTSTAAMRRRMAHSTRETAHGEARTAHDRGSSTFKGAGWADWAGPGVEGRVACQDLAVRHVHGSYPGDAAGPVSASRDITEGLGDAIRNYDPSGGTGRFKSS